MGNLIGAGAQALIGSALGGGGVAAGGAEGAPYEGAAYPGVAPPAETGPPPLALTMSEIRQMESGACKFSICNDDFLSFFHTAAAAQEDLKLAKSIG